jgi:predicted ATPase/class 3 adenylate cyclase/DNA-binding XRE family transcriptional regulator
MREVSSFGAWLKRRRKALDLTQADLARLVGCSVVSIRKVEADEQRPSRQIALRLAQHVQIAPEEQATFVQFARLGLDDILPALPIPATAQLPEARPTHRAVSGAAQPVSDAPTMRPSGTVTFLFTDIEGSTPLWEREPGQMRVALAHHDAILRMIIATQGGQVYKTIGDAFQAAFAFPAQALTAALAAQRALAAHDWEISAPLRVRMGIHVGPAVADGNDYTATHTLNRVARIMSCGHGGQILLSVEVADLVRRDLPADVTLRDMGKQRMKGLTHLEHLFQVVVPDLPAAFPPLKTLDPLRTNLPAQLTSFIGREKESAAIKQLLTTSRLTTLTGPGGTGKTRLALRVAAELLETFPDGVWLVELAPLGDPALVPQAVASALGLRQDASRDMLATLTDFLNARSLLLMLDNCEHVLEACAQLAAALLRACPNVRILASSREALGVAGEAPFRVPSLRAPDPRHLPPIEMLTQYEAVQLFVERAATVLPGFMLTQDNAPALAQVCARLDGIPLALELAAARVTVLRVEQIATRLDDRFRLLTGGSRTAVPRQQTLRALIDWSYDLLADSERVLLRRLSVFAGGWTLEAAEAVCAGDGLDDDDVLDLLTQLVNKSLAVAEREQGQETRYRLLETIRQYALERLAASGEADTIRRQHAAHYLVLAETADAQLGRAGQGVWLDRLEREIDNLRGALEWALGGGDAEVGVRLAGALAGMRSMGVGFWFARGYWAEGRRWLEAALARSHDLAPAIRAMLLLHVGFALPQLTAFSDDGRQRISALLEESLALFRAVGDRSGIAAVLTVQGAYAWSLGDYPQATPRLNEALALHRELGDRYGMAIVLHKLGDTARDQGDTTRATALLEESLALSREEGFVVQVASILNGLGDVACRQGDYPRAMALYWEALALVQNEGDRWEILWPLRNLGWLALTVGVDGRVRALLQEDVDWCREKGAEFGLATLLHILGAVVNTQGDAVQASALLRESLIVLQRYGFWAHEILLAVAWLVAGQRQPAQAARLLGVSVSMRHLGAAQAAYDHLVNAVRAQLDEATFAAKWAAGQAMSQEQAVAEAFQVVDRQPEGK